MSDDENRALIYELLETFIPDMPSCDDTEIQHRWHNALPVDALKETAHQRDVVVLSASSKDFGQLGERLGKTTDDTHDQSVNSLIDQLEALGINAHIVTDSDIIRKGYLPPDESAIDTDTLSEHSFYKRTSGDDTTRHSIIEVPLQQRDLLKTLQSAYLKSDNVAEIKNHPIALREIEERLTKLIRLGGDDAKAVAAEVLDASLHAEKTRLCDALGLQTTHVNRLAAARGDRVSNTERGA